MSFRPKTALAEGLSRTFERTGLSLIGAFFVSILVRGVVVQTAVVQAFVDGPEVATPAAREGTMAGVAHGAVSLPIPFVVAAVLVVVVTVAVETVRIVAVRTLVSEHTETIPRDLVRRRLGWATLNGVAGAAMVWFFVAFGGAVGVIAFVFGGPLLATLFGTSFLFVRSEIAVADRDFSTAMNESWRLTAGRRWAVVVLAAVVGAVGLVAMLPVAVVGVAGSLAPGVIAAMTVVTSALGAVTTVFAIAAVARAYDQLRAERTARPDRAERVPAE